jgi:predicted component of type VI protein secretion system
MPNIVQGAVRFDKIYLMPNERGRRGRRELGHSLRKSLARDMSEVINTRARVD